MDVTHAWLWPAPVELWVVRMELTLRAQDDAEAASALLRIGPGSVRHTDMCPSACRCGQCRAFFMALPTSSGGKDFGQEVDNPISTTNVVSALGWHGASTTIFSVLCWPGTARCATVYTRLNTRRTRAGTTSVI